MKFTVNRKIMREYLKSMAKLVPKKSPIEELTGFLIEANEDDGCLYLTATNMEAGIQRNFKAQVESGGKFVMNAKLLMEILSKLSETDAEFSEADPGFVRIKGGNCTYTIRVLNGEKYPRPKMPSPNSTVKVSGIRQLYEKTNAVVSKEDDFSVLTGIHIDITPEGVRAVGCDRKGAAIASREMQCEGKLSFTFPKQTLSYLAAAVGNDDELEVGTDGGYVIFRKEGLLFSAKELAQEYINVDMLFDSVRPVYTAKVEFDAFQEQISYICNVAAMGSVTSYIAVTFCEDYIELKTQNDVSDGSVSVPAVMVDGTAGHCFSYPVTYLREMFRTVEGPMILQADKRGYLIVMDRYNKFMTTPMTKRAVQDQAERYKEQMSKRTSKTTKEEKPTESKERAA